VILVAPIGPSDLEDALPLISEYQRFYEVQPDEDRNAVFFRRFTESDDDGMLLGARGADGVLVGYACLHWRLDTVAAREVVCLHDLFAVPAVRGTGAGRALLEAAADVARDRGAAALVWSTAPDNSTAQRLYEATGATRSSWYEYELPA
jgi:GNAT superfamily N-acetyltransferase